MAINKVKPAERKEVRIGLLGCGFMGKCHTNAYKKIPYIYPAAGVMPAAGGALRPEGRDRRARGGPLRLRGVLHRLAGAGRRPADRRVRQLRPRSGASGAVHRRLGARQARDLREADGDLAWRTPGGCATRRPRPTGKAMCTFNYRFMPAVRLAKDLIAEGRIGTIYQIRIHYLQMAGHDPSLPPDQVVVLGLAALGRLAGDRQPRHRPVPLPGRRDRQRLGPGADLQQGSGDPQRRLPGRGDRRRRHRGRAGIRQRRHRRAGILGGRHRPEELPRLGNQRLRTARSAGTWNIPTACSPAWPATATTRCWASREISVTESCHPYVGAWWPQGHNIGWEHCQIIEKFHFLDAVAHGKPLSPYHATFEDGYRVAVIIDAMRQSSRTGQRVRVEY